MLIFAIAALCAAPALVQSTSRVSVDSFWIQGNKASSAPSVSADGRHGAFESYADNLDARDRTRNLDVYVRDRQTGRTEVVSLTSSGIMGNNLSGAPVLSGDGRYVLFESYASNLVPGDMNADWDVFLHDRQTGQTSLVSVSSSGVMGNDLSAEPAISDDGRFIAFTSYASNLVPGDTNLRTDIFVRDLQTGVTSRVSVDSAGGQSNASSGRATLSADGRYVAYESHASNLVARDDNHFQDVFVHDRLTAKTRRVNVSSAGAQSNDQSGSPALSADGRFIAFHSRATNLLPSGLNGAIQVFVHDSHSFQTTLASVNSAGIPGDGGGISPALSADGRYVVFYGSSTNLAPGDTNTNYDVFLHDRSTGRTTLISVNSQGLQGMGDNRLPAISADGHHVVFSSDAANLVPVDTNVCEDVFIHNRHRTAYLSLSGTCDGMLEVAVADATPAGLVAILHGHSGSHHVMTGPCAGLMLNLARPVIGAVLTADALGAILHSFPAPAGACGLTLQAVDLATCTATGTAIIQPRVLSLAKRGICALHTSMDLSIANATPASQIALVYGSLGVYVKPGGACAGLTISISTPAFLALVTADNAGNALHTFTPPPAICGLTVQGVEMGACVLSNTITL